MQRREFITLLGGAAAVWPLVARAQQLKVPRVGILALTNADAQSYKKELSEGLRDLGYFEGQNFAFEIRSANGNADLLPDLAADLVRLKVDIIAAIFTPCALVAKHATREIPVVIIAGDPVGTGLVASLARPGGNITGLSNMGADTGGKSVELFRDIMPTLRRVAVLTNPNPFGKSILEQVQLSGRTGGIEIAPVVTVQVPDEVDAAFEVMAEQKADAVVVQSIFFSKIIADVAIKHRLPSAAVQRSYADAGGLMSYGADIPHMFRRTAVFVQKFLQGAKPAELPVEQPTKFELVINLKTAKAIGLTIPETFLRRVDVLIE
ncbi:MAG: ABC transporter substrate-binding protein [Pseudolabrys sp.]